MPLFFLSFGSPLAGLKGMGLKYLWLPKTSLVRERDCLFPPKTASPWESSATSMHCILSPIIVPCTVYHCVWNCLSWDWLRHRQDTRILLPVTWLPSRNRPLGLLAREPHFLSSCNQANNVVLDWKRVCCPHRLEKPRECVSVCRFNTSPHQTC